MTRRTIRAVGIHPNFTKRGCRKVFDELVAWLIQEGCAIYVGEDLDATLPTEIERLSRAELAKKVNLLVVLGGDGTLLAAARELYPRQVPILGVNFGSLGFLTEVNVNQLYEAMEQTLRGDYTIERRMMLRISILGRNGKPRATLYGLNDAVLHEAGQGLLELTMAIGKAKVGHFKADGVIIATPTGSTAYSLSSGGPILEPLLDALIATPICPHTLAIRPLIFPAYESITIDWRRAGGGAYLAVDGQVLLKMQKGESVLVGRAEKSSCFVQLRQRSFWEVLREKLRWGGAQGGRRI